MMGKTHVFFGATLWAATAHYTGAPLHLAQLAVAGFAALLPDLDHPQSSFGRKVPFLSIPISKLFGHRGATHSILAIVVIFLAMQHWQGEWTPFATAVVIGYASHLIGDFLTSTGVCFFWPIRSRFCLGLWKTDGKVEDGIRSLLVVGLLFYCLRAWLPGII